MTGQDKFCTHCGAAVAIAQDAPTTTMPVTEPATTQPPTIAHGASTANGFGAPATGATATAQPPAGPATPPPAPLQQQPYAAPPAPPAAPPPVGYLYPPPPPANNNNKGLIIGLSAALLVAIAGVLVAVLLAAGGDDNTPTVAAATPTASVPAAAVTKVTTVVETVPAKATKRRSSSPSTRSSSVTPRVTPIHRSVASASSATDKAEIRSVVRAHWADIANGNYGAAFQLLAPGSQSESSWISAHQADALTSASVSLGSPTVSGSAATVPVLNLHTVADSGCFDWSGYYEMSKIGGSWRIGKAKISRSSC